jgi:hypothetical protein
MKRLIWAMTGILAAMAGLACDDKNDVPPEMLRPRPTATTPPGPTTRDMVDGPKKSLRLGVFPLTLDVPKTWNLQSKSGSDLMTVEGPAVGGDIVIQLVPQTHVMGATGPERMLAEAKKDMAAKPNRINRAELRDLGPAKVLEVRMISNPFVNGQPPPEVWGEVQLGEGKISPIATTRHQSAAGQMVIYRLRPGRGKEILRPGHGLHGAGPPRIRAKRGIPGADDEDPEV